MTQMRWVFGVLALLAGARAVLPTDERAVAVVVAGELRTLLAWPVVTSFERRAAPRAPRAPRRTVRGGARSARLRRVAALPHPFARRHIVAPHAAAGRRVEGSPSPRALSRR